MLIMQAQCFELTKDTLYFILMSDLWVVYYAYSVEMVVFKRTCSLQNQYYLQIINRHFTLAPLSPVKLTSAYWIVDAPFRDYALRHAWGQQLGDA